MAQSPVKNNQKLWATFLIISVAILAFLLWWIYGKENASAQSLGWVPYLPYLNCALNLLTATLLCLGLFFVKTGRKKLHKNTMICAAVVSAFFLISYLTYHHYQGDTKFLGQGAIRYVYFFILISHIILSMIQVPLILATFTFAFKGTWKIHKKMARITFPVWLYVSMTGVFIFFFLQRYS